MPGGLIDYPAGHYGIVSGCGTDRFGHRLPRLVTRTRFPELIELTAYTSPMNATSNIQRATPEDAPAIARLNAHVHDLHVEAHPHYFRSTDLEELTATFRGWLEREDTATFIARDNSGTPIGYMRTRFLDLPPTPFHHRRTYVELDQIAIDPAHRRRGLAHAFVELARDEARARGTDRIHLASWAFNESAHAFFKSEGFEPRSTEYWQQLT